MVITKGHEETLRDNAYVYFLAYGDGFPGVYLTNHTF